ncbi:septation ring formation regulator EzrA [Peribacillus frigoritolerans]|uniref:septation ring formation regulator EzrA n=1 Tax=Peribacillus frigoritolerans TaxID=450367 RepID=UPI0014051D8E|nr:septation ring formation regulator EzrA [Peribacillus frigoritolerans]
MEVVIGLIVILLVLFSAGYVIRRNIYKEVDRLEALKIEIMNRSIVDELSKVKDLKMTGQAEELFERWRKEWDEIITAQLPEVEELLFDAEDYADKYRFTKSKKVLEHIEKTLKLVDESIEIIISEIHELISSEEKNSTEIEDVRANVKKAKKTLLAHSHTFGKSHAKLDAKLGEIVEALKQFEAETEAGNYLAAREILLVQKEEILILLSKIDDIPKLLAECHTVIPNQLAELAEGYQEMLDNGFHLKHIQLEAELHKMTKQLEEHMELLAEANTAEVKDSLEEIQEAIDTFYDLLEKEVLAHHYVQSATSKIDQQLADLLAKRKETQEEAELVRQSYQISEADLDKQRKLEKQINSLYKQFSHIQNNLQTEQLAHSILKEELEELEKHIASVKTEHQDFSELLQALRKEEREARQALSDARKQLHDSSRKIQKSNVPGLPESLAQLLQDAKQSISQVSLRLEEIPLNMVEVNALLDEAVKNIETFSKQAEEMIEQVYLAEKVIQYGNKYRRRNGTVADQLKEAELHFRKFEYSKSLEKAAAALEQVEPGSLSKLQIILDEETKPTS